MSSFSEKYRIGADAAQYFLAFEQRVTDYLYKHRREQTTGFLKETQSELGLSNFVRITFDSKCLLFKFKVSILLNGPQKLRDGPIPG